MKKIILLLLLVTVQNLMASNIDKKVSGHIIDENNKPIEYATVVLRNSDSLYIASCVSDSTGLFVVKYNDAVVKKYLLLEVSHLQYESLIQKLDQGNRQNLIITMKQQAHLLKEVTVVGNWIFRRDGNLVANISQMPGYHKYQTDKILKQLPGVSKAMDAGYQLNGKPVVFYINGVKQNITAHSLDSYLECLPADVLSEVELVNLNTGKYGSGTDAVIELRTKKNVLDGYLLQYGISGGTYEHGIDDWGGNVFYMVKKKRLLFHNLLTYTNNNNYKQYSDSTRYDNGTITSNSGKDGGRYHSFTYNSRLTYTYKNNNFFEFSTFVYYDFGKPHTTWSSTSYDVNKNMTSNDYLYKISSNNDLWIGTLSYTIPNAKKKFHGTFYYNCVYGGLRSNNDYYLSATNHKYQTSDLKMIGWMHTWAGDFASNFGKLAFLYGINEQYNKMKDKAIYTADNPANDINSLFHGREIISSAYLSSRYRFTDRLSVKATMRVENTDYKIDYISKETKHTQNYTYAFPSILLFYDSENYSSSFGLISGLNRPKYEWMIPGKRQVNDFYYVIGNPELKPGKSFSLAMDNTFFKYLYLNFRYSIYKNSSSEVYNKDSNNMTYLTYLNNADLEKYTINLTLPYRILNGKLYGQFMGNWTYVTYKKFKNGYIPPANRKDNFWLNSYGFNMQYDVTDRLNFSCDAQYTPKQEALQYTLRKIAVVNMGVSYGFLKNKNLILGFNVANVFASADSKEDEYFLDNYRYDYTHRRGPVCVLSLRLKLNKGQHVVDEYRDYQPDFSRMEK